MRAKAYFGAVIFLCAFTCVARADTIYLKNGQKITVLKAVEAGDHVTGETAVGEISLLKSSVDRIEYGTNAADSSRKSSSSVPQIAPPTAGAENGGTDTAENSLAVHDGRVDVAYIAGLDALADRGDAAAAENAALAHASAAQFEISHGKLDSAAVDLNRALHLAPNNVIVLLNASYLYLRQSEFTTALQFLDRAKKIAPDSPDVAKLSGWADYGLNRMPEAVAEWKRSLELRDDPDVRQALEKAQRDAQTESQFREGQTNHFRVRYSGDEEPGLAREVLATLEDHYDVVRDTLNYTPPEPIGVILYTNQQFSDITRAPSWVGALNDGRIRIPMQGLTSVTDDLSRVLKHELTHSFLQQKTAGRCPVWLQEGIAQWMEGRRSDGTARALVVAFEANGGVDLHGLEGSWMNLSTHDATLAYPWSLAVVEAIIAGRGMNDLNRVLDVLSSEGGAEPAIRRVFHMDYSELQAQTISYLHAQYLHN